MEPAIECPYETVEPGRHVCPACGHEQRSQDFVAWQIHRECPVLKTQQDGPNELQRAANFARAAIKQVAYVCKLKLAGSEESAYRSPAEIVELAKICEACPLFNGSICTHRNCGCSIDATREKWLSKLAWKTQRCPDDPPRWS